MGSKGKSIRSSQRKTGKGPPMGGVWKLQHQKKNREITGGEVKGVGEERVKMPL